MNTLNYLRDLIWSKAYTIPGHSPSEWRKDECGAWIHYSDYGDRESPFGWEIDHISPEGPTVLFNLRPLNWKNNTQKRGKSPVCLTTAKPFKDSYENTK